MFAYSLAMPLERQSIKKTIPDVKISNRIGEVAQHHTAGRKGATDESYCSIRVLGRQNTR